MAKKQGSYAESKKALNFIDREYHARWQDRVEYIRTQEQQATFYKMERRAIEYAKSFYRNISVFNIVLDDFDYILPLVFVSRGDVIMEDPNNRTLPEGRFAIDPINNKKVCIRIALPWRNKSISLSPNLKRTIRHELIHYYLYINDLPFADDTALFTAYCYLFDAGAYMPLSEEEEAKYQAFLKAIKDEKDAPPWTLSLLANAIIEKDENAEEQFNFIKKNNRQQ